MAEIAVEKKRGMGWLMWLLIAAALVLLLWWLFSRDRDAVGVERTRVGTDMEATTAPIRDAAMLYAVGDANAVAGRQVELQDARVLAVTGDRTFWIGQGEGQQVLVRLDQQPTPGQPATEGRYDVNPGQTVKVFGEVRAFPGWETARTEWNAPANLQSNFENQKIYIHANRLDITNRP